MSYITTEHTPHLLRAITAYLDEQEAAGNVAHTPMSITRALIDRKVPHAHTHGLSEAREELSAWHMARE